MTNYNIFSSDNIFVTSSNLANDPKRLNARCELLFKGVNFRGKRILDLGCHNGRWMYAAFKYGASFIVGVDRSKKMLNIANKNFSCYPYLSKRVKFYNMDFLEYLKVCRMKFDIIFCFGIMYHTINQFEILKHCNRINPEILIIDTNVNKSKDKNINSTLLLAHKQKDSEDWSIVPSSKMMEIWLRKAGFKFIKNKNLNSNILEKCYQQFSRITFHCRKNK